MADGEGVGRENRTVIEMSDMLVKITDIDVSYGNLQALWGVSLEVKSGEMVAVAGAMGAGKTTLLKTISGVLHPSKGSIEYRGKEITGLNAFEIVDRGISHVPEGRRLFPDMTVLQNLII